MAEEIKPIISIDVGDSQKTVKKLKDDIKILRDYILNLQKGTDEYNKAVDQLTQNQRELDEVMALTKKTATALDGSYDALSHKMALLKKEWRATNDEVRRSELGQQIAEINTQLKEFDAEVGNFQRNVGNYVSHWEGMEESTRDFGAEMRNAMEAVEPTKQKFESVGKIAGGLASGFAAVKGAAVLMGIENENLEKTFVQLQAAIALAQGVGGMNGLVEGIAKAKVAFKGFGDTIKSVSKAMGVTGWIGVIVAVTAAITALVVYIRNSRKEVSGLEKDMQALSKSSQDVAKGLGNEIAKLKIFQVVAEDVNRKYSERVEAAEQVLNLLGEEITQTNTLAVLNGEYADKVNQSTKALLERAKVEGAYNVVVEKYNEAFRKQIELEEQARQANKKAEDRRKEGNSLANIFSAAYSDNLSGNFVTPDELREKEIQGYKDDAKKYTEEAKRVLADADKELSEFIGNLSGLTFSSLIEEENKKNVNIDTSKVGLLKEIKSNIKIDTNVNWSEFEKGGDIAKTASIYLKSIEDFYDRSNKTIVEKEKAKLVKLQELREEAWNTNDIESLLLLDQQIADQEVAIVEAKNRQILDDEERTKKKREKIISGITTSLQAAGSVTQGILEITQAAAEADGKITEQEAKKIKGMQYATATINMLQGAITAFASAQQLGPVLGPIIGGANAAAVIAMGTANLMKIKNTDLTGSVTSGAMGAVTPNSNVYGTNIPISYTRNVMTNTETETLNQPIKAYVVESEITDAQNKNKNRTQNSEF